MYWAIEFKSRQFENINIYKCFSIYYNYCIEYWYYNQSNFESIW